MRLSALVITALVALTGCSDTFEERFSSMNDVKAQGMVARGWIPSGLPAGTEVVVRWNIDTNMVRGRMSVSTDQLPSPGKSLTVPEADLRLPFHGRGSVTPNWWPRELSPPGPTGELRAAGWDLFIVQGERSGYVAVRRAESRLYFWSEGS